MRRGASGIFGLVFYEDEKDKIMPNVPIFAETDWSIFLLTITTWYNKYCVTGFINAKEQEEE